MNFRRDFQKDDCITLCSEMDSRPPLGEAEGLRGNDNKGAQPCAPTKSVIIRVNPWLLSSIFGCGYAALCLGSATLCGEMVFGGGYIDDSKGISNWRPQSLHLAFLPASDALTVYCLPHSSHLNIIVSGTGSFL